ncbi:MAG: hypothetical protein QOF35_1091 [Actinomycetota bacterium]|nr:hypothetical protein [Actinomycetota bacterium]
MTQRLDEAVARTRALVSNRAKTGLAHEDADADIGTIGSDDALNFDPRPLLASLQRSGVHIVVIGQVAGILYGSRELTGDLDLLWAGNPDDAEALAAAFSAAGADLADDQGRSLPCTRESFLLPKVVFRTAHASGDCCTPALPWGNLPVRDILARSTRLRESDDLEIAVISRDDLIGMRRAAGRAKDIRRADELEQLQPDSSAP